MKTFSPDSMATGLCPGALSRRPWHRAVILAATLVAATAGRAGAQSSSLLGDPAKRPPLTMANSSFIYQAPAEPKVWKKNDFVTVLIEERSRMIREGQIDQRKKSEGAMTLNDWIALDGFAVVPDPQTEGDPKISGILDNKYRAQANLQNRDTFETSIQCVIVDIRPNGTLVIEGHAAVKIDEEEWELSVSGVVRPEDILPNNTVKSEKLAEKRIQRLSSGQGRDGMRRGWLQKIIDKFQPF
jgi:flagellar L-ring protein precursor FlgH